MVTPEEEHLATRRSVGLFDFSFMGLYEFPDRASVEGVQTRSLDAIEPGQIAYTLLLNEDGGVFNDATVWHLPDGRFWLFTGRPSDFKRIRTRAPARDRSGDYAILALQGPRSGLILSRLIGEAAVRALRYFRFAQFAAMLVGRLGYSGELGYELLVPRAQSDDLRGRLLDAGSPERLGECSFEAANSLRIECGYVLFDREIDGAANPQELGLGRLVSDKRRAFPVSRTLTGLELMRGPVKNTAPAQCAQVTSECFSPTLQRRIGLGFVPPALSKAGTVVDTADGRTARVVELPFHDPQRRLPRAAPL